MRTAAGCGVSTVFCDGRELERIKVQEEKCPDCNAKQNQYHHYGCDQEICPACGSQLRTCNCEDIHFIGLSDDRKSQEELQEEFPWIQLDYNRWEISLVTKEYIFCGCLADAEQPFKVYLRDSQSMFTEKEDTTMFFEQTLFDVFLKGLQFEYMSFTAEKCLEDMKKELLKNMSK